MEKKKILVIEDNLEIREGIVEILELAGHYEVFEAENGQLGVDVATERPPDLILCDIMMPELDGYGVLYMLSKFDQTRHIPLIFLTAKSERSDIRKAMEMGADDYIVKPFDDVELLNAVEGRLKKRLALQKEGDQAPQTALDEAAQLEALEALINSGRKKSIKKRQLIFETEDHPIYVYYVLHGKVRTFLTYPDGRMLSTGIYVPGQFFGFETVMTNERYTDSATPMEDAEVVLIPKADFYEILYRMPTVANRFVQMLSHRVRERGTQMLGFAYDTVRKRVANALLQVAESSVASETMDEVVVQLSREDLAALAGTANETISRMLADFKEEALITKKGGTIKIHSLKRLQGIR